MMEMALVRAMDGDGNSNGIVDGTGDGIDNNDGNGTSNGNGDIVNDVDFQPTLVLLLGGYRAHQR